MKSYCLVRPFWLFLSTVPVHAKPQVLTFYRLHFLQGWLFPKVKLLGTNSDCRTLNAHLPPGCCYKTLSTISIIPRLDEVQFSFPVDLCMVTYPQKLTLQKFSGHTMFITYSTQCSVSECISWKILGYQRVWFTVISAIHGIIEVHGSTLKASLWV